ncbi:MAG: 60S ribosomal protein L31 [Nanoarchaeota archaeon]|nr:60S ribosomal protein L31 [Nanoarchaeota archaeon]
MAKKESVKTEKFEREYVIPLREKCRPTPSYKKTPKSVKTIKEFLVRHMKIRDRDLNKIKIDLYLNEYLWMRGIKKPLHKVKVKAVKDGEFVRVYSVDLPERIKFKKSRLEKMEKEAKVDAEKQKTIMEKAKESLKGKKESAEEIPEEEMNKEVGEEKQETSKLSQEQIEKEGAKEMKHTVKTKPLRQKSAERKGYDITSRGR